MATENLLRCDGSQLSAFDGRNSTYTGSTLSGPDGSAQFLAVRLSTSVDKTVAITTAQGQAVYGILQNKPRIGEAANVAVDGSISKCVSGSTAIAPGMDLMCSTLGTMIPFSSGNGIARAAKATEAATSVGQIFSAALYGWASPGGLST